MSNCVCLWVFAPAAACGRRGPLEKTTTEVPRQPRQPRQSRPARKSRPARNMHGGGPAALPWQPAVAAASSKLHSESPAASRENTKEGNYQKNKPPKNTNKSLFTNRGWGSGEASRRISPSLQCKSRQQILPVDVSIDSARPCSTYVAEAGSEVASWERTRETKGTKKQGGPRQRETKEDAGRARQKEETQQTRAIKLKRGQASFHQLKRDSATGIRASVASVV